MCSLLAHAAGPAVSLSPTNLTFGTQLKNTTSPAQNVTLTNTGNAILKLTTIIASSNFGQTNTCPANLGINVSCTISVTFTPTANGTVVGAITITDNANNSPQSIGLSGTGTVASLSPASTNFGSQTVGIASSPRVIMLSNVGTATLHVSAVTFTGTNAADFSQTNNCATLGGGGNCTINVTFTPGALGNRSGNVNVTFTNAISPVPASLSGTGVSAAAVALSPTTLTFASQQVGTTSPPQSVTLTNTGGSTLTLTSITASAGFGQTNTCGSSVAAGASCSISVTFTPSTGGTTTGTVSVVDNAAGSPQTVSLTGTGLAGPVVTLSPTTLTFAGQVVGTTSPPQSVTLTNTGASTLTLTSITASAGFGQTNTCGSSVVAGASCSISVTFTPTTGGTATGTISVVDNATGSPQTVSLTGTGLTLPAVTLSPTSLTFAGQLVGTTSAPQSVTLTNAGGSALTLTSITASAGFGQTNTCGSSVAAGASCSISVTFTPSTGGTTTGTVSVVDNATGSPQTVSLTGTGLTAPAVTLSPTSLTFSSQPLHSTSAPQNVTLTNTGSATLTITSIATNSADFLQSNNCGGSVAAGGTCSISVQFQPTQAGTRTGSVLVTDNATGSPQSVSLTGTAPNPVPYLHAPLAPTTAPPGSASSTLTLNGTEFVSGASVLWNGSSRVTTFVNGGQLQAALTASDVSTAGTARVVVTNPGPGGGASNAQPFQIANATTTVALGRTDLGLGTGANPRAAVVADFNGDGKPDVAVVNRGPNTISIFLGNGDGTFAAPVNYSVGVDAIGIAAGDMNGDGKLDLLTTNRASYTISILFGNGDGTFGNRADYTAGTEPMALVTGDFDGDGFLDVAEINGADDTVSIFLSVGDGTLKAPVIYPVGSGPIAIVTGDFNHDGILDIAVANAGSSNIAVLLGNGGGTFQSAVYYPTGSDPDGLFTADLNGDGKLDLVAANNGSNTFSVLLNNGDGTFAPQVSYSAGTLPFGVTGGDFYGNGKIDLAITNSEDNTVSIVPGNGDGTFNTAQTLTFSTGNEPLGLAVGDFNNDGRPDVVVANAVDNSVSVLLQIPTVSLSTASLAFGTQNVGSSSATQTITLTNSGSATLVFAGIALAGSGSSQYTQGNTCAATLAPGANCAINITFVPTALGTATANVTINNNAPGSPQTVSLLGTGIAPVVSLAPTSLTFASQILGTTSPAQTVTLTNTGSTGLTITSIVASTGYAQTNTCGSSVAAGAACSISVTFAPTITGTQTGTITLTDNAVSGSQTISLTGTGSTAPAVSIAPSSLTFSSQPIDSTSATQNFTLTNTGSGALTVTSVATTGDYSQTNNCGSSVAAGANCTISVAFTPISTGVRAGTVVVTDNASNSPQTVTMSGTGATPTVTFAPTSLTFANQSVNTTSAAKTIKLTNNTGAKLTITRIAASANFSQTNTCGTGGANGGSCVITVTFTPTAAGVLTGTISVTDNVSTSPQTVPLTGTGVAASVGFSPTSLTFANQTVGTSSAASTVILTNSGSAALTITGVSVTGANNGDFTQTSTCSGSIAAGASCSINVTFAPTATGTRTANVTVNDSATGSPQNVPISGTGIAPAVGLSPPTVTFASQAVGSTSAATVVTLSNSGNAVLTINSIGIAGANAGDFGQTNNCGSSLAAATSCTINATFSPTAAGTRTASVSISDNASGSPQSVSLTGTGTAPAVSLSTSSVTFPGQAVGTTSAVNGITLFNTGNATLSLSSITITGANSGDFSQSNTCGLSVPAGGNCTINVAFSPTVAGTRNASLSISDNAAASPQLVSLTGTGTTGGPMALVSPLNLTFASQNLLSTSAAKPVTLTNTGASPMTIVSIVASGDFAQTNNCGSSLGASASCIIQVTFSPSNTGTRAGYVTITDNDPSTLETVTLTGTGTAPSSTVSVTPFQASVTPGQSTQFQATISNHTSSNVTWSVDGINGGNSTVGTISSTGLYTAPSTAGRHSVTATSTANTTQKASVPVVVTNYAGTFVYHNDNGRTGQNLNETVLNAGNVNNMQFGKLFSYAVDGQIYAEPLYVQNVSVAGQGVHNVVYVVTENDSVYAFDADGRAASALWQVSFLTGGAQTLNTDDIGGCANIAPQVGITSTPVIDPQTNTIYVLARTKTVNQSGVPSYFQTLHALDITTGLEQPGSPVVIQATVNSNSGPVSFNPQTQNQRAGLFIVNGVVYISWAAHCDIQPFHGWIMGYQENTLQQVAVFNTTPNGSEGGIWQSGAAPAVDAFGNIYAMVGNGTFDGPTGGSDYGEGLLKLSLSGNSLAVADYFVPSNVQTLNASDLDLGSGGPLLIPDQPTAPTQMLVAAGKQGMVYLVDRTNLGQYNSNSNQVLQTLPAGTVPTAHSMPAYWQNNVYFCGVGDYAKAYLLLNGMLSPAPTSQSSVSFGYPGATPVVSSNGNANGLLWVLSTVQGYPALLHVYDAANLSRELYNSDQDVGRDEAGIAVKFTVPTVANGKVYVGTAGELDVYGLLPTY